MKQSGIFLINKPINISSHNLLLILKKKFNINKIGHAGTLDPLASGLLIVLVNQATKISDFLLNDDKEYIVTMRFNILTTTGDITGDIIKNQNQNISKEEFKKILMRFIKKYDQVPPIYSAIKVGGKKLYEYALKKQDVVIPSRLISIYDLQLLNFNFPDVEIKVKCSKGTYIRSLVVDIAKEINMIATVINLKRTMSGTFSLKDSNYIENVNEKNLLTISEVLSCKMPIIEYEEHIDIINGKVIILSNYQNQYILFVNKQKQPLAIYFRKDDNKYYCKRGLWLNNEDN